MKQATTDATTKCGSKYRVLIDDSQYLREFWLVQWKFLGIWITMEKFWSEESALRYFSFLTKEKTKKGSRRVIREWPQ